MKIKIPVTQEDIDKGLKGNPAYCPIALACRREFPKAFNVRVTGHYDLQSGSWWSADISMMKAGLHFDLTAEQSQWARHFDQGHKVEPFEIEVEL